MGHLEQFDSFDRDTIIKLADLLLGELNIGMLIFSLDFPDDPNSLKLLYANQAGSDYTGTDLSERVGKTILEAFPGLEGTSLPEEYAGVALSRRPRSLGSFEYDGDSTIERSFYSVKAFPMPHQCVGVAFENITARKKLEALLKSRD